MEKSYFLIGFGFPWSYLSSCGKLSSRGGLGGIWLVLREAQVEEAVDPKGPSPPGTPMSWTQALPSEHTRRGERHVPYKTPVLGIHHSTPQEGERTKERIMFFKNNKPQKKINVRCSQGYSGFHGDSCKLGARR